jgi:hypothetical protein
VLITLTTTVTAIHHKPSTLAGHHLGALVLSGPSDRPSTGRAHERNGRSSSVPAEGRYTLAHERKAVVIRLQSAPTPEIACIGHFETTVRRPPSHGVV